MGLSVRAAGSGRQPGLLRPCRIRGFFGLLLHGPGGPRAGELLRLPGVHG